MSESLTSEVVGYCRCGEPMYEWEEDPDVAGMFVCCFCGATLDLDH